MPLFLVRHGQTDWNLAKRFQSTSDIPLNDTGRAQAKLIGGELRQKRLLFSRVATSPLGRAQETAQIIVAGDDVETYVDPDLIELSLGDFEGQSEADLRASMGEEFDAWRASCFTQAAPNGETIFDAIVRAARALEALIAGQPTNNYLLVAHQGMNMAVMALLSGRTDLKSLSDFKQANDQVEVWDTVQGRRLERFSVSAG